VIIDDDRDVLDVLGEAVTAFGYHAFPAANAVHGLREVRERRPHVIRLDLRMPALDGHTVFERLISLATPSSIVIVSGQNDETAARCVIAPWRVRLPPQAGRPCSLAERHRGRGSDRPIQLNLRARRGMTTVCPRARCSCCKLPTDTARHVPGHRASNLTLPTLR